MSEVSSYPYPEELPQSSDTGLPGGAAIPSPRHEVLNRPSMPHLFENFCQAQEVIPLGLRPDQRPKFARMTHQFLEKHVTDVTAGAQTSIAEPLKPPLIWPSAVDRHLDKYYQTFPAVLSGKEDKIQHAKREQAHDKYRPVAEQWRGRFPEIPMAQTLESRLTDDGHEIAAGSVADLLTAYGMTLTTLQAIADRDKENRLQAQMRYNPFAGRKPRSSDGVA